jgi:hypothetical protein
MANGWTPERKAKQRKAIYAWRPWEKSTGPKTPGGKVAAARNAWKHGHRSRAFAEECRRFREFLEGMAT